MANQAIQFAATQSDGCSFGSVASLVISITGPASPPQCRSADGSHVPSLCAAVPDQRTLITVRRISMQAMTTSTTGVDRGLKKAHSSRTFCVSSFTQSVRHQRCRPSPAPCCGRRCQSVSVQHRFGTVEQYQRFAPFAIRTTMPPSMRSLSKACIAGPVQAVHSW